MTSDESVEIRRATLAEVAELAGVSLKTASRALGGEKYVASQTRGLVHDAAKKLGYRRNAAASVLASRRHTDSIGLIVGEMTNPFYAAIAEGLERALPGTHLVVADASESMEREWLLAQRLAESQVQAIVVASSMRDHSPYQTLADRGIALVFVDRPPINLDADCVLMDNYGAGLQAGHHLIAHGHTKIGIITDYAWLPTQRDRLAGLLDACDEAGVSVPQKMIRLDAHDANVARSHTAALLALSDPPTAIVGGNNRIVLGMINEFSAQTRSSDAWPSFLGFDDFDWAPILRLTVLSRDPRELGRQAADLITTRLNESDRRAQRIVLPMTLTVRGSGEHVPV